MILDEPTSAMDSWTEAAWFNDLRQLTEGRTAIVITHRFTIAMRADIIYVMNEGQVIETGSHSELLKKNGLYAKSWWEQMHVSSDHHATEVPEQLIGASSSTLTEQPGIV